MGSIKNYKKVCKRTEQDIQEYICKKISGCIKNDINEEDHNYSDIGKLDFDAILSTNYDHIIWKYINSQFAPVNLTDLGGNTQYTFGDGNMRIFHLHGNISQPNSIVITQDQYDDLYKNSKYDKLFSIFQGTKTFLFIGCSFTDTFLRKIVEDNNQFFKTKHYILFDNPDCQMVQDLKMKYNIEAISYDGKCGHAPAIRRILTLISNDNDKDFEEALIADEIMELLLDKLPSSEEKQHLEECFFCKKLRLEEVGDDIIDYSKNCFYTAEQYIRWLNKSRFGRKHEVIRFMLDLCYARYQDLFIRLFGKYKDSEMLINDVHEALLKIDLSRIEKLIDKEYLPTDINKQGFVHVLADDIKSDKEVWWGEKRLE